MAVFKLNAGGQWVAATRKRWNGVAWALIGQPAPEPPPAEPTLNTLRQVTDRTFHNRHSTTIAATTTHRTTYAVKATGTAPRIILPELATADPYAVVGASIEYPAGTLHPVTFAGAAGVTVANLAGPVTSDAVTGLTLTAGSTVYVRVAYAAGRVPVAMSALDWLDTAAGDLTTSGTMTTSTGAVGNRPAMLGIHALAASSTVSVALIGDSITEGGNDTALHSGGGGYARRALGAVGLPYTNYAVWANTHVSQMGEKGTRYGNTLSAFTHGLCAYGFNDVNNYTLTAAMANTIEHWNYIAGYGVKLWQTTITPETTSTDSWATTANQTPSASWSKKTDYNNWIRDGAPILNGTAAPGTTDPAAVRAGQTGHPLKGYVEVADTAETARNSGIFRVDLGQPTTDGGHPSPVIHQQMMVPVQAWAQSLTA